MQNDIPTESALSMKKKGFSTERISEELRNQGYNPQQISEAINQLNIKGGVEDTYSSSTTSSMQPSLLDEDIPVPTPPEKSTPLVSTRLSTPEYSRDSEELIEAIIDEKWQQIRTSIGDIEIWKGKITDDLEAIKQEILRLSQRIDHVQNSVIGKVTQYEHSITDLGADIKALEKVFQNIMQPLTSNVKELSKLTAQLKKSKK
jgi:peptidoglycan hydrolase CwlO-like protein